MRCCKGKEYASGLSNIERIKGTAEGNVQPLRASLGNARPHSFLLAAKHQDRRELKPLQVGIQTGSRSTDACSVNGKALFFCIIKRSGQIGGPADGKAAPSSS